MHISIWINPAKARPIVTSRAIESCQGFGEMLLVAQFHRLDFGKSVGDQFPLFLTQTEIRPRTCLTTQATAIRFEFRKRRCRGRFNLQIVVAIGAADFFEMLPPGFGEICIDFGSLKLRNRFFRNRQR